MELYREVLDSLAPNQKRILALRLEDEEPFARIAESMAAPMGPPCTACAP